MAFKHLASPQIESPARRLKQPAGLTARPCRCRLGSRPGQGVRVAPEAKIASKRGRGYHGMWPYRLTSNHLDLYKVGDGCGFCKSTFQWSRREPLNRGRRAVRPDPDGPASMTGGPTSGGEAPDHAEALLK